MLVEEKVLAQCGAEERVLKDVSSGIKHMPRPIAEYLASRYSSALTSTNK